MKYRPLTAIGAVLSLLFSCHSACGQYDNIWAFGDHAGIDFNDDPPKAIKTNINTREGSAVMCNKVGALLFYTDGTSVWDKQGSVMPNGNDLPGPYRESITTSTAQGALIVPVPGSKYLYYVFSLGAMESGYLGHLCYTLVDMRLNNGLGDVVPEKKGIRLGTSFTEHMTSVPGNHCDIWVIVIDRELQKIKAYNINHEGIDTTPVLSNRFPETIPLDGVIGSIAVSPDRSKVAIAQNFLTIYDFDPTLGTLSHALALDRYNMPLAGYYYGVDFSPDGTKLYGGAENGIFQFDLSLNDINAIKASRVALGKTSWSSVRRAPDGKVYCANLDSHSLNIIHDPNLAGVACRFRQGGFPLAEGTRSLLGLPNVTTIVVNEEAHRTYEDSFCAKVAAVLTAADTNGINYTWNDGSTGRSLYVDTPGTYWVNYQLMSSRCMDIVDTFYVRVKPFPTMLDITPECKGEKNGSVRHRISSGDTHTYSYQWRTLSDTALLSTKGYLAGVRAGNYQVSISSDNGCNTTLYFTIDELDVPVDFLTSATPACIGEEIRFYNQSDPYVDTLQWDFGDGHYSTIPDPVHTYLNPGVYLVTLIGKGNHCSGTSQKAIVIDAPVGELRFYSDKKSICTGESIRFHTTIQDSTLNGFYWWFPHDHAVTTSDRVVTHAFDHEGDFQVLLTAHFRACPEVTFADSITVHPLPLINLGPDSVFCLKDDRIILANKNSNREGDRYLWSTGATSPLQTITHEGKYSLTITNRYGCTSTASIRVDKGCYLDIPNAFTPNSDGTNDYFFPRQLLSNSIKEIRMQVRSRWGQKVFETTNSNGRGWDGRFHGIEQPPGVYVFILEVAFRNGRSERYEGNVTLIR